MAAGTEMVPNGPLCGKKSLGMSRGFEAAHRSLSLACWLVRVLRPIVEALVLAVLHAGQYILFSCCIAAELIGDQHARDILTPFQQLSPVTSWRQLCSAGSVPGYLAHSHADQPRAKDSGVSH